MTNKLRPLLATEVKNLKDLKLPILATVRQMKVGSKNGIPRLPTFVGLRDKDDMS